MPQIDQVSVRSNNSGVTWVTGQQATAPDLPLPTHYIVYVNATEDNQPPAGFLDNPADQFVVQGRYLASGQAFTSGNLTYDAGQSDPPLVYVFKN